MCDKDDILVPEESSLVPYLEISTAKGKSLLSGMDIQYLGRLDLDLMFLGQYRIRDVRICLISVRKYVWQMKEHRCCYKYNHLQTLAYGKNQHFLCSLFSAMWQNLPGALLCCLTRCQLGSCNAEIWNLKSFFV